MRDNSDKAFERERQRHQEEIQEIRMQLLDAQRTAKLAAVAASEAQQAAAQATEQAAKSQQERNESDSARKEKQVPEQQQGQEQGQNTSLTHAEIASSRRDLPLRDTVATEIVCSDAPQAAEQHVEGQDKEQAQQQHRAGADALSSSPRKAKAENEVEQASASVPSPITSAAAQRWKHAVKQCNSPLKKELLGSCDPQRAGESLATATDTGSTQMNKSVTPANDNGYAQATHHAAYECNDSVNEHYANKGEWIQEESGTYDECNAAYGHEYDQQGQSYVAGYSELQQWAETPQQTWSSWEQPQPTYANGWSETQEVPQTGQNQDGGGGYIHGASHAMQYEQAAWHVSDYSTHGTTTEEDTHEIEDTQVQHQAQAEDNGWVHQWSDEKTGQQYWLNELTGDEKWVPGTGAEAQEFDV